MMKVIDATNLVLGRMATRVAKLALSGEEVAVVNCEKAVISGRQNSIVARYKAREVRATPFRGPRRRRHPERIVKRAIRGMLPAGKWTENSRGRLAFGRVKCYLGIPTEFKDKPLETIEKASFLKVTTPYYLTIEKLSQLLKGGHN
ncbi:MAG: 50S ribosomal protein L13 [DPANN group archaeon]|nr:50S ribosomal protein L13 [DPANN group archaeon]